MTLKDKKVHKRVLTGLFTAWVMGVWLFGFVAYAVAAGTASMSAVASQGTVTSGAQFQVTISVSSDTPITVAQAYVTYDTSKLSLVGTPSYVGSPLNTDSTEVSSGSGYYQISRYKSGAPYPSGTFTLAVLTFRASTNGGNTTIGITTSKSVVYDQTPNNNVLTGTNGATVTLAAATNQEPSGSANTDATIQTTTTSADVATTTDTPTKAGKSDSSTKKTLRTGARIGLLVAVIFTVGCLALLIVQRQKARDKAVVFDPNGTGPSPGDDNSNK